MTIQTVTFEVVREGPEHNQLLSPLTRYLALSGNNPVERLGMPFEHLRFMRRLRELNEVYDLSDPAKNAKVQASAIEMAADMGEILGSVRCLPVEIAEATSGERPFLHLRMVLSSSELSLLPFELADSPGGFPGAGQSLSLQTAVPIALTREARRVPRATVAWPDRTHILVVAAQPRGVPPVPLRAHLLSLREALDPWLVDDEDFGRHVTVLPTATIDEIRDACRRTAFTHVHVLAHGKRFELDGGHERFGVALHDARDRTATAVIDGARLADALRCHFEHPPEDQPDRVLSSPVVVTLATCESSAQGDVIAPGAGVAHELHVAGIPFVLASQFPLTVSGSVVMTKLVYDRLLRGEDPRRIVHDLRQALRAHGAGPLDWASMVAYASLPADIDHQIQSARFHRAHDALIVAHKRHDRSAKNRKDGTPAPDRDVDPLREAYKRLAASMPDESASREERMLAHGRIASACKLLAQVSAQKDRHEEERDYLAQSRNNYKWAFELDGRQAWAVVQYLAASQALDPPEDEDDVHRFENWWNTAYTLANDPARSVDKQSIAWALGAKIELFVLAQRLPPEHWAKKGHGLTSEATRQLKRLLELKDDPGFPMARFDAYSVYRQLRRYVDWWWTGKDMADLCKLPNDLIARMDAAGVELYWVE